MTYLVPPGLYAVGMPGAESPVVVTGNYKMTYDVVRRALAGRDAWVLVLETYGINVWCAAGKGTFGTDEVVGRVASTGLADVVRHRRLLLPVLGAPGVSAHEVTRRCGFSVHYAAVSITDLPEYLDNGRVTTPAMRKVGFSLYDRLVLIPVEVVLELKNLALGCLLVALACTAGGGVSAGLAALGGFLGAALGGLVAAPLLLPWLPTRSFVVKGAVVGLAWTLVYHRLAGAHWAPLATAAAFLCLPAASAFYTLNFTGCTTFTSRSGVKKEMKFGIPSLGAAVVVGVLLLVLSRIVG